MCSWRSTRLVVSTRLASDARLLVLVSLVPAALLVHAALTRPAALVAEPQLAWPTIRYAATLLATLAPLASYTTVDRIVAGSIALIATAGALVVWKGGGAQSRPLLGAAVVAALVVFAAPSQAAGGTLVTARLVYFPLFLVLVAMTTVAWPAAWSASCIVLALLLSCAGTISRWPIYERYDARMSEFLQLAETLPLPDRLYFAVAGEPTTMTLDDRGTPNLPASAWGYVAARHSQLLASDYEPLLSYFPLVYRTPPARPVAIPEACGSLSLPAVQSSAPAVDRAPIVIWMRSDRAELSDLSSFGAWSVEGGSRRRRLPRRMVARVERGTGERCSMTAIGGPPAPPIPSANIVRDLHRTMGDDADRSAMIQAAEEEGVTALLWESLSSVETGDRGRHTPERNHTQRARCCDARAARADRAPAHPGTPRPRARARAGHQRYRSGVHACTDPRGTDRATDTDLLIDPNQTEEAIRVLESCGYARSDALTAGTLVSHQAAFERVDDHGLSHVIDLHWRLVNPQVLANALPFEYLWQRAQPVAALGPDARTPCPVDAVLVASIHRLAHHQGQDRLIWLYDLHLLTTRFTDTDWSALAEAACRFGVAGLCLDGLRQARARTGTRIPPRVEELWQATAPSERSHVYVSGPVLKRDVLASDLAELPGWRARARLVKEHAFPPAAFMRTRYGVTSAIWLPALYVHRLITGTFKWLRH